MKIAIAGVGKLGMALCESLMSGGHDVTLIDINGDLLEKISQDMDLATVTANALEVSVLRDLKIQRFDYLAAVTGQDEKNMLICRIAKELGCPRTIARVREPEHVRQVEFLQQCMQVDFMVNPDLSTADAIYKYLVEKYNLSGGCYDAGQTAIVEFEASKLPGLTGRTLASVSEVLPGMLVLALDHDGKVLVPHGDTLIEEDDILYVIGLKEAVMELKDKVHEGRNQRKDVKRVMIAGGGKLGYFLSRQLAGFGASVKLIEKRPERCRQLVDMLDDVLVLCGDASDPSLLEDESIGEMDAFVSATNMDEENLLLALLAHQHNVEEVVSKVSRKSYASLISQLGISALNPVDSTAANILRYIQGSEQVLFAQQIRGQAEFIKILADDKVRVLNVPLSKMKLPEGILIASIERGDQAIIPDGSTTIQKGDRVLALCMLSRIAQFEQLFLRTKK